MAEKFGHGIDSDATEGPTVLYKGCVLPKHYLTFAETIENFEVRDDDVWVVSYPKCGTTWTQETVWCVGNGLDFKAAETPLIARFPFLEFSIMLEGMPNNDLLPPCMRDSVKYSAEMTSPRYIKTHLPWQLLPRQIRDNVKKPKIIYVARNAKDVCVSYYHHSVFILAMEESLEDFCRGFVADKIVFCPFWPHILDFWAKRHEPNVLFLTYEKMKKDISAVIREMSEFLGKPLSDDQVTLLADHVSFANMKNNKAVNYEEEIAKYGKGEGTFIRKGEVGGWKASMSKEMIEECDKWTKRSLQNTDYKEVCSGS